MIKIKKDITGEITTQQIVLLIILLVSFSIILFLLFRLDLGKESEKEICHNSVVMRGLSSIPAEATPLKCSRDYVCVTEDGSCERMTDPEIKNVKSLEEVYGILAEEMANCWWMFGEGKVDYVGKDFFLKDNYCSICSQIAFDDSLNNINEIEAEISKDEFYNYLSLTPMPGEEMHYAEYLFGTDDVQKLKEDFSKDQDTSLSFGKIYLDREYFIMTGITSEVTSGWIRNTVGIGTAVAGILIPGVGWTYAGGILGILVVGGGSVTQNIDPSIEAIVVKGKGIENNFMAPTIQEANSETLKKLNCYDIVTNI